MSTKPNVHKENENEILSRNFVIKSESSKKIRAVSRNPVNRKPLQEIQGASINTNDACFFEDIGPVEHVLTTKKYTVTKQSTSGTISTVTKKCSTERLTSKQASSNRLQLQNVTVRKLFHSPVEWDFPRRDSCALINDNDVNLPTTKTGRQTIHVSTTKTRSENKENEGTETAKKTVTKKRLNLDKNVQVTAKPPAQKVKKVLSFSDPENCEEPVIYRDLQCCTPLEHNRIKNIKKTLKRPQSAESVKQPKEQLTKPKIQVKYFPRLHLDDNVVSEENRAKYVYSTQLCQGYMPSIIKYLLKREEKESFDGLKKYGSNLTEIQRSYAINWIFKVNDHYKGSPNLIHSAVRYFDKCLAQEKIDLESLQLIAATCYWIVQKQQTKSERAKSIVEFCKGNFKQVDLINSERYILRRLYWPQIPITCDDFIYYFAWISKHRNQRYIMEAARFLNLTCLLNINLAAMKPSALSFACVALALKIFPDDSRDCILRLESTNFYYGYEAVQSEILYTVDVLCQPDCSCQEPIKIYQRPDKLGIATRILKIILDYKKNVDQ